MGKKYGKIWGKKVGEIWERGGYQEAKTKKQKRKIRQTTKHELRD